MRPIGPALAILTLASLAACGDDTAPAGEGGGGGGDGSTTSSTAASGPTTTATTGNGTSTGGDGGAGGGGEGGAGGGTTGAGGFELVCEATPSNARIEAVASYSAAVCDLYARCWPSLLALLGGDPALCEAIGASRVESLANVDEDALVACLEDSETLLAAVECSPTPGAFALPASCDGVGTLPVGAGCANDLECASGACGEGEDDCGTCIAGLDEGDACDEDVACAPLACVDGTCQEPQPDGSPCDAAGDCAGGACAQGECATVIIVGEGEACGGLSMCALDEELLCDPEAGECVPNPPPTPGALDEACAPYPVDLGGFVITVGLCEPGAGCIDDTCVAVSGPGGSCAGEETCVQSTCEAGTCIGADPNACACGE